MEQCSVSLYRTTLSKFAPTIDFTDLIFPYSNNYKAAIVKHRAKLSD